MASDIPNFHPRPSGEFRKVVDAFLGHDGLPFAEILSAQRIERIFDKHGALFGLHGVYDTAIMLGSFG